MDQSTIVELLRSVPLFFSLPDHDLVTGTTRPEE
jgi:hypothetical protein